MNQQKLEKPKTDKLTRILEGNFLAVYINLCLQGIISFGMAVMFGFLLRFIWKDIPLWLLFPLTFAFMILFSVIYSHRLSRIQIGYQIQNLYINFLKKYI